MNILEKRQHWFSRRKSYFTNPLEFFDGINKYEEKGNLVCAASDGFPKKFQIRFIIKT